MKRPMMCETRSRDARSAIQLRTSQKWVNRFKRKINLKKRKLNFSADGMIRLPIVTVHRYDVSDFPPSAGTFRAFFERSILVLPNRSHFHVSVNNISNFFILSIQRIAIGGGDTT
jgi:hypothetical protein